MVQFMRDIGYVIKLKVKVDYIMQMEIFMMEYIINIYFQDWEDHKSKGHGIYIHSDGARYEGGWNNDL